MNKKQFQRQENDTTAKKKKRELIVMVFSKPVVQRIDTNAKR
jgi:hypothetical protein